MKISKLFHWLYACVMFLPLLVLPIFAIYIINHVPTPLSIDTESYEVVDFNQLIKINDIVEDKVVNDVSFINNQDYSITINGTATDNISTSITTDFQFYVNRKYAIRKLPNNPNIQIGVRGYQTYSDDFVFSPLSDWENNIIVNIDNGTTISSTTFYINVFDLTQMFGVGNEPSIEDFNSYFPNDNYNYTLSRTELLNVGYVTLDDADLGSQYIYSLYNVVDKYFNFTSFVPFERLYSWFVLVVFSASVPLGFIILYNLMIYWLFISLIWLMFDVFMYVPLVIHNLIDKARIE